MVRSFANRALYFMVTLTSLLLIKFSMDAVEDWELAGIRLGQETVPVLQPWRLGFRADSELVNLLSRTLSWVAKTAWSL